MVAAPLQVDPAVVADGVNYLWILVVTFLIFFMHAGFAMLEAGQVRSKNVANQLTKNMLTWSIGVIAFFLLGAGIASLVRQGNFQDHVAIGGYYIEGLIPGGGTGVQLYTQDGSDVESPSDLAGRTLALGERGSTSNLLVKTVLDEQYNLSPSDYEIVYKPDSSDILLEQGDVDAALVWTRHIVDPEWRAQYTKVLDAGQEYADMYGAVPSNNVIVADREAVMQNPERYRKAVELVWRSHYWAEQNRDVVAQDFKSQNPDFNISAWKEELQYNDYQHNMTAERIRANNKLFEVQSKYSGVNSTVQMDDFYVNVTELAAER